MAGRLEFRLLGDFEVWRDGAPVGLPPSKKTRALLAYLAVAERPQRREFLCDMFWDLPDDPRGALRWSLSKIRQIVDGDGGRCLDADRQHVFLRRDGFSTDLDAIKRVRPHMLASLSIAELEAIAGAFRGGFLEDLSMPRCLDFEAWRIAHAHGLEILRAAALGQLVERLKREDPPRALMHAHALRLLRPDEEELPALIASLLSASRASAPVPAPVEPSVGAPPSASRVAVATAQAAAQPPQPMNAEAARQPAASSQQVSYCTASDGVHLAYAAIGEGPVIVRAPHWMTHLEYDWDSPLWRPWMTELTRSNRLLRFDQRCNGLSERGTAEVSFEAMVRDLETVVDRAGVDRFVLLGISQSCATSVAYAVRHPNRVRALILYGGYVKGWRARGDAHEIARREAMNVLIREGWGLDSPMFRQLFTSMFIPHGTPEQISWYNELQRRSATVQDAWRLQNAMADLNVTELLSKVCVPTLVVHAAGDCVAPIASGRAFAESIPGARFVELESDNHILLEGEPAFAHFWAEVRDFLARLGD